MRSVLRGWGAVLTGHACVIAAGLALGAGIGRAVWPAVPMAVAGLDAAGVGEALDRDGRAIVGARLEEERALGSAADGATRSVMAFAGLVQDAQAFVPQRVLASNRVEIVAACAALLEAGAPATMVERIAGEVSRWEGSRRLSLVLYAIRSNVDPYEAAKRAGF